jgi:multicomponent Na+:H+ antiporter subunit D
VISAHLPALQVVVPLLAAPICAVLRHPTLAWGWATLVAWATVANAALLLWQVRSAGPISYRIGNWEPPWGIEYRVDTLGAFIVLLVAFIAAIVLPYARRSLAAELPPDRLPWYYTMVLLSLAGLLGMTVTGDAFNIFVFMEIASLSSYVLIAMGRNRRALVAAYQYLIIGTIGATFYVIGVGFLYLITGTLNIADLAERLPQVASHRPMLVGMAFIAVGLSLKFALFPLHFWLPNAYAEAPSAATAFLAGTATKVAVYLLLRFFFTVFGRVDSLAAATVPAIWITLSVAAMLLASCTAVFQDNVKRLLALSSVAQIGTITLGIALATDTSLTGAVVHLFNHGLMKVALFMLVGGIAYRTGSASLPALAGIARRMPLTMAGIVIAGMSLVGIPGTVGFISKWYLILAAVEQEQWWLAAVIVLSSLLALVYVGRILEVAYMRPTQAAVTVQEVPAAMLIPAWVLVLACIWFGIDTGLTVNLAAAAARGLLGVAP